MPRGWHQITRAEALQELRRRSTQARTDGGFDPLHPPAEMTFREWCNELAESGLKVDGKPFSLSDRPTLWFIYDLIPTRPVDGYDRIIALQKGAQMGLTIWEVLADLFLAIKGKTLTIAMYVPDSKLAPYKSEHRFLRLVRSIPRVHSHMREGAAAAGSSGEGNKLTRIMGDARFLFLWTSGATMTESFPADVVSFDEVQNMTPSDISKVRERLSASSVRFTLLLSTPKWPDADINYWYVLGTQHEFWSECTSCGEYSILTDYIPDDISKVIRFDVDRDAYHYACPHCGDWIEDTQRGEWRAKFPDRSIISAHLPQILSPTITADQLIREWQRCTTGEQRANFINRKVGKPYSDPSQIPVNLAILRECAEEGMRAGLTWKTSARGHVFMGIDQMGEFNVVIIKERMADGRQAVIHVEAIYSDDPFARCSELLDQYGVQVCVVESLPNYNDAKRFANRHPRRVFLASYGDQVDMVSWGDQLTRTDRKTDEEARDRYAVRVNQYKAMQVALGRVTAHHALFPDPTGIEQEVLENGVRKRVALCQDVVFLHLTRVALITERDPETSRWSSKVKKVGIDPHFAYAWMLCEVAWSRAWGTSMTLLPDAPAATEPDSSSAPPGLPAEIVAQMRDLPAGTCGRCSGFDPESGRCASRGLLVQAQDAGCVVFAARET